MDETYHFLAAAVASGGAVAAARQAASGRAVES
jgi:hypothetical protein